MGPKKLKGTVYVRAGGMLLAKASDSEVAIKKGGVKREPVTLDNGDVYYTEQAVPASIECTVKLLAGMTMQEFQGMTDVTVTVEADDGWTGILANAFCGGDLETGKGGDLKVAFYGATLEETTGVSA